MAHSETRTFFGFSICSLLFHETRRADSTCVQTFYAQGWPQATFLGVGKDGSQLPNRDLGNGKEHIRPRTLPLSVTTAS